MRWSLLCFGLVGALGAQDPLHIVSVERRGPPPYESADRIYCLNGGQDRGLHIGDRLIVRRPGEVRALGYLRVTQIRDDKAESTFEPNGSSYPLKGDLVLVEMLTWMPALAPLNADPFPLIPAPSARIEAPPQEGIIFFLPQQAELSPAGLRKMETWVETWGHAGRWAVQVPATKSLSTTLQTQRAESLLAAMRALGIEQVTLEAEPRTLDSKYDPAWIRHWD